MARDETPPKGPSLDHTIQSRVRRRNRWRTEEDLTSPPPVQAPEAVVSSAGDTWLVRLQRAFPVSVSALSSTAVHLTLFIAAALIGVPVPPKVAEPVAVAAEVAVAELEEVVTYESPVLVAENAEPAALVAEGPESPPSSPEVFAALEFDPGVAEGGEPEIELFTFASTTSAGQPDSPRGPGDRAGRGQGLSGEGKGAGAEGDGMDEEPGTEFFGVQAQGNRFVFVCDCSRSMTGPKWLELHRELGRCIGELGPDKSFYIIFFDGEMHPMFAPFSEEEGLLAASEANVEKARIWLASVTLGPNTEPFYSMKFASSLEPDAIFFLTDGEFSDYTAPYLREYNRKRKSDGQRTLPVHTIAFFSNKGRSVLQRIAKDSGGTYKFIAEPHVAKPKRRSWNVYAPAPGGPRVGPMFPAMPVRPVNDG